MGRSTFRPALFVAVGATLLGASAHAASPQQYVQLRRREHADASLTYAAVAQNPSAYVGRVLEVSGRIKGTTQFGNTVSVMLYTGGSCLQLDVPAADLGVLQSSDNPSVRALVRVGEGSSGNVPRLSLLAMVRDSDVAPLVPPAPPRAAAPRVARGASRAAYASRGNWLRNVPVTRSFLAAVNAYTPLLGPRAQPLFQPYLRFVLSQNHHLGIDEAAKITYGLLGFADQLDVDPRLVVAMIIEESGFNPNSTSRTGAMGLGQLMPGTARSLGVGNAYDPIDNLRGSITYLREHLDQFSTGSRGLTWEQVRLAMAAYNAGSGAVRRYGGVPPYRETQAYVRTIEAIYRRLLNGP